MKKISFLLTILFCIIISCGNPNPNVNKAGNDELKSLELDHNINKNEMVYKDIVYVPIYSDIYIDVANQKSLLAATLSIRNTSFKDSLFVSKIDYFDSAGSLVRSYITKPIGIAPMGTVNYVIEKNDDTGGSGANFIVALNAKSKNVRPLIQAIMIGEHANKGFSFSTDGYSLIK
ncbi:MAG: DUF3124 domain-containing protein [Chitinophagales bacterium]